MKKILVVISTIFISLSLTACGKYEPKLSELGVMYHTKDYTFTGTNSPVIIEESHPTITIKSIDHDGKNIIIKTASPYEHIQYALNNFLSVSLLDEKGNSYDNVKIYISENDEQAILKITGKEDLSKFKYIKIYPYSNSKYKKDNYIEFEIK